MFLYGSAYSHLTEKGEPKPSHVNKILYLSTSGRPATLVSSDRIPASTEALATILQSTADRNAELPIVATAVCATVLIALTPAAFHHFVLIAIPP
jgi:hypothetical protein